MTTQFFGQRITRNEDPRLLRGQALFVDDVHLPDMAHVAFVRSPHAHARILSIDVSGALEKEGVVRALTAEDLYAVAPSRDSSKLQMEALKSFSVWGFYIPLMVLAGIVVLLFSQEG